MVAVGSKLSDGPCSIVEPYLADRSDTAAESEFAEEVDRGARVGAVWGLRFFSTFCHTVCVLCA